MNDAKTPPIDTASQDKLLLTASMQLLRYSREKIFIKDANLIYCAASTKFAQMAGWKDENDLIGKTDFDIFEDQALAQRYTQPAFMRIQRTLAVYARQMAGAVGCAAATGFGQGCFTVRQTADKHAVVQQG